MKSLWLLSFTVAPEELDFQELDLRAPLQVEAVAVEAQAKFVSSPAVLLYNRFWSL